MAYDWERVEIETTREMETLLDWLSLLATPEQVSCILDRRIRHNFFFEAHLSPGVYMAQGTPCVIPGVERLLEQKDVELARDKVVAAVTKALQFWRLLATRDAGTVAEPIILFYGIEALSEALVHATFVLHDDALGRHGVSCPKGRRHQLIKVQPECAFALAHAACHIDPYLLQGTTWTFKTLAAVNLELYLEYQVAYGSMSPQIKAHKVWDRWELENERVKNSDLSSYIFPEMETAGFGRRHVMLHPLDYRFLTAFLLSNLARYETDGWLDMLETREGFLVRSFLTKTIRSYPNVFLNQMWGRNFIIGPIARTSSGLVPNLST